MHQLRRQASFTLDRFRTLARSVRSAFRVLCFCFFPDALSAESRAAIFNCFQFPSGFHLEPSFETVSAARSIAFRVLFRASQASDVGSIPIARSINPVISKMHFWFQNLRITSTFLTWQRQTIRFVCGGRLTKLGVISDLSIFFDSWSQNSVNV
jgi:hypothetical protein